MARTRASLPAGLRLSDDLSVGVIARTYPREEVQEALARTGRGSVRRRSLPAEVMVYYVIAMAVFRAVSTREILRCLLEGLRWVSPELYQVGQSVVGIAACHNSITRPVPGSALSSIQTITNSGASTRSSS